MTHASVDAVGTSAQQVFFRSTVVPCVKIIEDHTKTQQIKGVYVYVSVEVYTRVCGHICPCMWGCIHVYVGIYIRVCGGVYTCMWAYMQVCLEVIHVYVGVYTCVCGHIYRCMWKCIHGYVGIYTGVYGGVYTEYVGMYVGVGYRWYSSETLRLYV